MRYGYDDDRKAVFWAQSVVLWVELLGKRKGNVFVAELVGYLTS